MGHPAREQMGHPWATHPSTRWRKITAVVTGNDGNSPWPIGATLDGWEKNGVGTNALLLVGFGTAREQVLARENRAPNADELRREQDLVRQGMREGAFGMSTGLFYVP